MAYLHQCYGKLIQMSLVTKQWKYYNGDGTMVPYTNWSLLTDTNPLVFGEAQDSAYAWATGHDLTIGKDFSTGYYNVYLSTLSNKLYVLDGKNINVSVARVFDGTSNYATPFQWAGINGYFPGAAVSGFAQLPGIYGTRYVLSLNTQASNTGARGLFVLSSNTPEMYFSLAQLTAGRWFNGYFIDRYVPNAFACMNGHVRTDDAGVIYVDMANCDCTAPLFLFSPSYYRECTCYTNIILAYPWKAEWQPDVSSAGTGWGGLVGVVPSSFAYALTGPSSHIYLNFAIYRKERTMYLIERSTCGIYSVNLTALVGSLPIYETNTSTTIAMSPTLIVGGVCPSTACSNGVCTTPSNLNVSEVFGTDARFFVDAVLCPPTIAVDEITGIIYITSCSGIQKICPPNIISCPA
jgi:hypothetical protein